MQQSYGSREGVLTKGETSRKLQALLIPAFLQGWVKAVCCVCTENGDQSGPTCTQGGEVIGGRNMPGLEM